MPSSTTLEILQAFFIEHTGRIQSEFFRTLPLGDLIVDRWEKARLLGFGEGANIYDSAIVFGDVQVGEHTWIGPQVILDGAAASLCIGAWCSISAGTHIYTHNSVGWSVTGGKMSNPSLPVIIGSRVYIGPMCVVSCGVNIGSGSIIGTHSFVHSDIPPGSIAWGQPARVMGKVVLDKDGSSYHIEYDKEPENKN